jgi:hypothetical protein
LLSGVSPQMGGGGSDLAAAVYAAALEVCAIGDFRAGPHPGETGPAMVWKKVSKLAVANNTHTYMALGCVAGDRV